MSESFNKGAGQGIGFGVGCLVVIVGIIFVLFLLAAMGGS